MLSSRVVCALLLVLALPFGAWALPRNIILMIPDGTGHASLTAARQLKGAPLALDQAIYGIIQTRSASSSVTDSAAAATALACGERTYNGAVGVNPAKVPLQSIAEAAKACGKAVGIVTTDTITGATPAGFSAHVTGRAQAETIFEQQLSTGFDLFLGGGREHLTPAYAALAKAHGYALPANARELATADGKVFGLFSKGPMTAMVERRAHPEVCAEPTLPQMAAKALDLLSADPDGFFLMIEGAQVDHGNHAGDLPWATYEMIAFDDTVALVLAWAEAHPETIVMIMPDHETGGLTLLKEPTEGARAQALSAATAKQSCRPEKCFVHYSSGSHTGVDVFLAGNTPTLHPTRNCDVPRVLGHTPATLRELQGTPEVLDGVPHLRLADGTLLRAQRDAIYIPETGRWFAR